MAGKAHKAGATVRIGLSGWSYSGWKDTFYAGVKRKDWLTHAASRFPTLEVNATFYRGQQEKTFRRWRAETPNDFLFSIKGHRVVTHRLGLRNVGESVLLQRDNAKPLGTKLACVLWQLRAVARADKARLAGFLKVLKRWPGPTHVMEFRDPSWFTDENADMLEAAGVANCISHAADWEMWDRAAGPLAYVRLHGAPRTYASAYGPRKLSDWADRIEGWQAEGRNVFVYFDNDAEGAAFRDAARLMEMLPGSER